MKTMFRTFALILLAGLVPMMNACKKTEEVDPTKGLSAKIQSLVSQTTLADLKAKGLVVNEGSQPPNIEGIFVASPMRLLSQYGPTDNYAVGEVIADYKFRFYGQTGDEVKLDYKNNGSDTATGKGAFISGYGNKFTIFIATTGTASGIPYKSVNVVSGEMGTNGIINFQQALTLTEKTGDPYNNVLMPLNKARVWEDGDRLATKAGSYRVAVTDENPSERPAIGNK